MLLSKIIVGSVAATGCRVSCGAWWSIDAGTRPLTSSVGPRTETGERASLVKIGWRPEVSKVIAADPAPHPETTHRARIGSNGLS
ncbi:MAG: hypothetical protein WBW61_08440, partial [Rhodanobacteraceae bacterium]